MVVVHLALLMHTCRHSLFIAEALRGLSLSLSTESAVRTTRLCLLKPVSASWRLTQPSFNIHRPAATTSAPSTVRQVRLHHTCTHYCTVIIQQLSASSVNILKTRQTRPSKSRSGISTLALPRLQTESRAAQGLTALDWAPHFRCGILVLSDL